MVQAFEKCGGSPQDDGLLDRKIVWLRGQAISRDTMSNDIANILGMIPELAYVSIRAGSISYTPPLHNLFLSRVAPVLAYLRTYSSIRSFNGEFFLCLYDGWREYSAPFAAPVFVPWKDVEPSRYLGVGSAGEPRFFHQHQDGIFPELPLPVLTFCRHYGDRNAWLMPDAEFLANQFVQFTAQVAANDRDWGAKDGSALYWRGVRRNARSFDEPSPRDFVTSFDSPQVNARYSAGEVSVGEFLKYKYLLDIDGMASAWSGLYWKLRSNSVPVKLKSHWEQWYYHTLRDAKHLVLTDRDLLRTYEWISSNDALACKIAQEGKVFSRGLSYAFAVEEYVIR